jgi:SAM-dependent methyltransferase
MGNRKNVSRCTLTAIQKPKRQFAINAGAGQHYWEYHALTDPMWAILTDPTKTGGRWTPEEFFATGLQEITDVMAKADRWGLPLQRKRALDFGCGVGRLTQALGDRFERVTGVDISPTMLELARKYNRHGDRCEFVWNAEPNLRLFADRSFDMIYSNITLQHIVPRHTRNYLREFLRLLAPGGLLLFQIPGNAHCPYPGVLGKLRFRLNRLRVLTHWPPLMYMNGIDRPRVVALLEKHGGRVIEIESNEGAGPEYESYRYAVTRG